jgi:hypothetical protein
MENSIILFRFSSLFAGSGTSETKPAGASRSIKPRRKTLQNMNFLPKNKKPGPLLERIGFGRNLLTFYRFSSLFASLSGNTPEQVGNLKPAFDGLNVI